MTTANKYHITTIDNIVRPPKYNLTNYTIFVSQFINLYNCGFFDKFPKFLYCKNTIDEWKTQLKEYYSSYSKDNCCIPPITKDKWKLKRNRSKKFFSQHRTIGSHFDKM